MTQSLQPDTPAVVPAKISLDRYHQMVASGALDDLPVELLNGVIVEMPPEGPPHAYSSHGAAKYLARVLGNRADVRPAKPITLPTSNSEPEPDIAIVADLGAEYRHHHPYPDNIFWVIEYSDSSLKKDLDPKAKLYAAAGIAEYWVINLRSMELVLFRDPLKGEYQSRVTLSEGIIRPLAFPDVAIEVLRLLG
jgi:Uma2 family endonuclease